MVVGHRTHGCGFINLMRRIFLGTLNYKQAGITLTGNKIIILKTRAHANTTVSIKQSV